MPPAPDRYDAIAYPGYSYPNTHPDRLATMAILHGLSPAPVERCRVLEVACGDGANLIPMAYAIPKGEFVGFDLARLPVERAQARIGDLGLTNIRITQGDLLSFGADLGRFDYVIVHGFYSWVPQSVRNHAFALCSEVLAPDGIVFVSYNALPGSYTRMLLRDMMMFRAQGIDDPEQRVRAGLEFLHLVAEAKSEGDPVRVQIQDQLKRMEGHLPACTYHDEFSPEYKPLYFTDFIQHARQYGLEYVCDAEIPPPADPSFRAEILQKIEGPSVGDDLKKEQILDFIRMRPYRETLLCRADRKVRRDYFPESFSWLLLASEATSRPGKKPGGRAFEVHGEGSLETNQPAVIGLLEQLIAAWPRALSSRDWMPGLEEHGAQLDSGGALLLMRLAVSRVVEFRSWNAPFPETIPERPRASACTRQAARLGIPAATLLHVILGLDDPKVRSLLLKLDGTRTRGELIQAMQADFADTPAKQIEEGLDSSLRLFQSAGALEA